MNHPQPSDKEAPNKEKPAKPTVLQVIFSVFAAAFGVQTNKNRERDFQHGSIWPFIAAGLIFTALFVLGLVGVVKLVLA